MPQRKPYNTNTKYGRKKLREQYVQNCNNATPEQKKEIRSIEWWITILVFLFIALLAFLIGGVDGLLKLGA